MLFFTLSQRNHLENISVNILHVEETNPTFVFSLSKEITTKKKPKNNYREYGLMSASFASTV